MNYNDAIKTALSALNVPVALHRYNGKAQTYITFFRYNRQGEDWAENDEILTAHYYQIDFWQSENAMGDIWQLEEQAETILKSMGFSGFMTQDLYESDTKIYHIALRCVIYEEREI